MRVTVIGTGYVGLVSATCFAEIGHEVMGIDIDAEKIKKLAQGISPIYETGLDELLQRNVKEGRIRFSTDIQKGIEFAEVVLSAVGTPPDKDHRADLKAVKQVAKSFGMYLNGPKIFVNKSTVPVGTGRACTEIIQKELRSRKASHDFDLVSNPEFLREGAAIKDTMDPDRIVIGADTERAKTVMKKLYAPIVKSVVPILFTSIESAEIIKYASNAFLATKISFINQMANFCERSGADIQDVAKGIGLDKRIGSRFLHAGIGYGGSCFPKDVQALIKEGKAMGYDFNILEAVEQVNKQQKEIFFNKLLTALPILAEKTVAVWGLAFKPKTDDLREAPSILLIKKIIGEGGKVRAYDPVAMDNAKKILRAPNIYFAETPYDAVKGADVLLIVTEWDVFRAADLKRVKSLMKGNLIIDGRNVYTPEEVLESGLKLVSIGRSNPAPYPKASLNIRYSVQKKSKITAPSIG